MKITIESTEFGKDLLWAGSRKKIVTIYEDSDDQTVDDLFDNLIIPAVLAYGYQEGSIKRTIAGLAEMDRFDEEVEDCDAELIHAMIEDKDKIYGGGDTE